jgi:hypothetical protein
MSIKKDDLDHPASAFWAPGVSTENLAGGRQQHFESVRNAVGFVMEKLAPIEQSTAFIQTDARSYRIEEIREIYASADFKGS